WAVTLDLPRGGGKTAADVIAKRDTVAAELGVDEIQVIMTRVRAAAGGHAGRVMVWVADDDPYLGAPNPSPLASMEQFSVWEPIPFGQDARGRRITLVVMWQSMFFGGLPRRGKTFAQRLASAAGVLDAYVRHYVADGKGGADWRPMRGVAHRLVIGAEDDAIEAFLAMLEELITEMGRRFAVLGTLPTSVCPEGKLTPEISRRYGMPVIFITIDELQEYLSAMPPPIKDETVEKLARLARRAPAAGFILNAASQRPDADSVPAKLREIITYRYCTQVVDRTSSDMVLGKGKAAQGADASILSEDHKGVGVLVTGPGSFEIVRCDYMDLPTFAQVCAHGRALRVAAGTLTGDAASDTVAAAEATGVQIPTVLADVLYAMHGVERMHTSTLLARLVNMDEEAYGDYTSERLAE
ncbi:MAG: cell division protein FtsK, partial [Pseudonocardiaceae bacterium]